MLISFISVTTVVEFAVEKYVSRNTNIESKSLNSSEVVTRLDRLHPTHKPNGIFPEITPVEIHASELLAGGIEYSLLVGVPIRSNKLTELFKRCSDLPFNGEKALIHLLDESDDEFGGVMKKDLNIIGEHLDARDDTVFIDGIKARIKSHQEAWRDLVGQRGMANALTKEWDTYGSPLNDAARIIIDIMKSQRELWPEKLQDVQVSKRMAIERFGTIVPQQREWVLMKEMSRFGQKQHDEQRRRIDYVDGIRIEVEEGENRWYLVGKTGTVSRNDESSFTFSQDKDVADIEVSDGRFLIRPQSKFLLPTLTWRNNEGKRNIVVPSKFTKSEMIVRAASHANIFEAYKINPDQMANSLMGIFAMHNILEFPKSKDFPPEFGPELAYLRRGAILESELVKNAEDSFY